MSSTHFSQAPPGHLLSLSAEINRAETVDTAVTRTVELAETVFGSPAVSVWEYDPRGETQIHCVYRDGRQTQS